MSIRKNKYRLLLLTLALSQAGCSTGPLTPIEGPVNAPQQFKGDFNGERIQGKWWENYHDPVLNQLVKTSLRDNPNLGVVYARLRAAREQVNAVSSTSLPRLDADAGIGYARTSPNTPFGLALGQQSIKGSQYSIETRASWEPDLWGRVANAVKAANTRVELAKIDIDSYMLILCSEVVQFYWQMRSAEADLAFLQAVQRSHAETVGLLTTRYRGGLEGELDLARARAELANSTADMEEARKRRELNEHSLATLTARPVAEFSVPAIHHDEATADWLPPPPPRMAPGAPATILSRRPDLAASAQDIRAAIADRNIAETAFYPTIKLTGDFGFASRDLGSLLSGQQLSFGPLAISLPIFDGGRNKANLAAADARYQEAVASHKSKLLLALKEVDDALTEIATNETAVTGRQQALDAARRAIAVAKARQKSGLTNYLDVLESERTMLTIERASLQNRMRALVASVELVRAVGGGWDAGSAVTPGQLE
ncbi:efflux transporter outer membrane subunit [Caballeronia sp. HLA56]